MVCINGVMLSAGAEYTSFFMSVEKQEAYIGIFFVDCDDIDDQRYQELSKDSSAQYKCVICRGEKEERMDAFHKKHRGK